MALKINRLSLGNYKRFESLDIGFKKLTLLTGPNSSGKSAVLSSLAALSQTQQSFSMFPFLIDFNSDLVSLGSYKDIVNDNKTTKPLSVGIDFSLNGEDCSIYAEYRFVSAGGQVRPNKVNISNRHGSFSLEWRGQNEGYYAMSSVKDGPDKEQFLKVQRNIFSFLKDFINENSDGSNNDAEFDYEKIMTRLDKGSGRWESIDEKSPRDIARKLYKDMAFMPFMQTVSSLKTSLREQVAYLGPIRAYPGRVYRENSAEKPFDPTGMHSYQLLQQWKKYEKDKYKKFSSALSRIELAHKFEANIIQGDLLEFFVRPFGHKEMVNIVDAGFGVSQISPIFVRDISLPDKGTLLVNQPEVHLHPSSQALLADYFCERLGNRNYIMETHSEYLINRLRLLVSRGKASRDDIGIIFLSSDKDGKAVSFDISINKDGSLSGAPKEFFRTYYQDSFELAMGGFDE